MLQSVRSLLPFLSSPSGRNSYQEEGQGLPHQYLELDRRPTSSSTSEAMLARKERIVVRQEYETQSFGSAKSPHTLFGA